MTMSSPESHCRPDVLQSVPAYKRSRLWIQARNSGFGEWVRACRRCPRELRSWFNLKPATPVDLEELSRSIALLGSELATDDYAKETVAPIFLLSVGWRAGSTLLQRVLVTDPSLLLWGEPLGEMALLPRMTEMISHFISDRNLKEWRSQPPLDSPALSQSWIANLYPPGVSFRAGLRSLFDQWLSEPAKQSGYLRWGLKEVRIGAREALLLHWLYPKAKFVIISRHPYDCYRSLVDAGWGGVFDRYPKAVVDSAASFARHWNQIAVSLSQLPAEFPIVKIKYDDLISGKVDFRRLETWLDIRIKEDAALSASVGGTATRAALSWYERLIIRREASQGMRALGYAE